MKQTALLAGCVLGLGIIICGWREYRHRNLVRLWMEREQVLHDKVQSLVVEQEATIERADKCEATTDGLLIEVESLRDRGTNLAAQRDHLRAESERQSTLAREKTEALEQAEQDLQATRHELLLQSAVPRSLEAKLALTNARIQELETDLDEQSSIRAMHPNLHTVEGISNDASVIALAGDLEVSADYPYPIRLCRRNELLLDGWINRNEEDILIGHVGSWQVPSSALVKGEKVFILRGRNHDSDP